MTENEDHPAAEPKDDEIMVRERLPIIPLPPPPTLAPLPPSPSALVLPLPPTSLALY